MPTGDNKPSTSGMLEGMLELIAGTLKSSFTSIKRILSETTTVTLPIPIKLEGNTLVEVRFHNCRWKQNIPFNIPNAIIKNLKLEISNDFIAATAAALTIYGLYTLRQHVRLNRLERGLAEMQTRAVILERKLAAERIALAIEMATAISSRNIIEDLAAHEINIIKTMAASEKISIEKIADNNKKIRSLEVKTATLETKVAALEAHDGEISLVLREIQQRDKDSLDRSMKDSLERSMGPLDSSRRGDETPLFFSPQKKPHNNIPTTGASPIPKKPLASNFSPSGI